MILFKNDFHYQPAIYHTNTTNASFIRMSLLLQRMGIQNNKFFLALTQPELEFVRPHELENPSPDLAIKIARECKVNPWYYFREIVRIPSMGGEASQFVLNRANLALLWSFFNNIHCFLTIPRQTGKTISTQALISLIMYILAKNFSMAMLTKDAKLVQENVKRLKDIRNTLPKYLVFPQASDIENKEGLSYAYLNNKYTTLIAQADPQAADSLGRGLTLPFVHIDEIAYFRNIEITYPTIMATTSAGSESAKMVGLPHSNILTTTAGLLDTPEGSYAFSILNKAMRFHERLYDLKNKEELDEVIKHAAKNKMVYITYSFLQLGKSHEWFDERVANSSSSADAIDKDYLNIWKSGTEGSILPQDMMRKIKDSQIEPLSVDVLDGYIFNWYCDSHILKDKRFREVPYIMGMDASENVGRDYSSLVIIDPSDMSTVGTCKCNESNLVKLAAFIVKMLLDFPRMVWIPERNSVGAMIVDYVILELEKRSINPFTRIFNQVIQHKDEKMFKDINIHTTRVSDGEIRKYFGFRTTGGENSRKLLYTAVFKKSMGLNSNRIYDATIIREILQLTVRNGRIDHAVGGHDDTLISYLLTNYFIFHGVNLHYYGIRDSELLCRVAGDGSTCKEEAKHFQIELRQKIGHLKDTIRKCTSPLIRMSYERELRRLEENLDDDFITTDMISIEHNKIQERELGLNKPKVVSYDTAPALSKFMNF